MADRLMIVFAVCLLCKVGEIRFTLISAGPESGKTTMLNARLRRYRISERLLTIEDGLRIAIAAGHDMPTGTKQPPLDGPQ